ncbi:DnaJ-domain-containing protein [Testicularia cyperi]|uniref:DnaJ-domain-containing protein n=1 Tax=Testicularia cyperi TaxID=1882483 RepID=A0A317XNH7_9BASI|nr:DnaJ-domain-containing protein [Testicularia cyperi]
MFASPSTAASSMAVARSIGSSLRWSRPKQSHSDSPLSPPSRHHVASSPIAGPSRYPYFVGMSQSAQCDAVDSTRSLSTSTRHSQRHRQASHTPASSPQTAGNEFSFPSHLTNPTPYDVFHFSSRAVSQADIKARYYDLVRALHPDRHASASAPTGASDTKGKSKARPKTDAEEQFKTVVAAYHLLKDPHKKQVYDRSGFGWAHGQPTSPSSGFASSGGDPWRNWQDMRYTRRTGARGGHDRFGWQNQGFYSNQYNGGMGAAAGSAGWNGGNGQYTSNGIFISTLFLVTWVLAGLQYSRLSLQSQKAIERADKHHLDAARSLHEARELARSEEGKMRLQAFRRRAREQKIADELDDLQSRSDPPLLPSFDDDNVQERAGDGDGAPAEPAARSAAAATTAPTDNPFGIGHGGPSGKEAAQKRFEKARALQPQHQQQHHSATSSATATA